jgi:hypothetical protein
MQRELLPVAWRESARAFMTTIDAPVRLKRSHEVRLVDEFLAYGAQREEI